MYSQFPINPAQRAAAPGLSRHTPRQRFATVLVAALSVLAVAPAHATLTLADFDVVAFKWNTGESVTDSPIGVSAVPEPVLESAVNMMLIDRTMPVYITDGPLNGGEVLFGYVDSAVWTPSDGDGLSLDDPFSALGDRVYVRVDGIGNVELRSAPSFSAGIVLDSTTVTLDPDTPFFLEVLNGTARLYYGSTLVTETPVGGAGGVIDPVSLGDDFVVSVTTGSSDTGRATINDVARNAHLQMTWFPRILEPHGDDVKVSIARDVLDTSEEVDLALYLTNAGSAPATGVTVQLIPSAGSNISVVGGNTRDYGTLAPGASTVRTYSIQTSSSPVGVHPLTLQVTGGVTQTLTTYVPVWDISATVTDLAAGEATVTAVSPFATHQVDIVAPEQVIDPDEPYAFLLTQLDHTVTHSEPFYGVHWGDLAMSPLIFNGTAATPNTLLGSDTFSLTVEIKFKNGTAVPGAIVECTSAAGTFIFNYTDANGIATFPALEVAENPWTVTVKPPAHLAALYNQGQTTVSPEPTSWKVVATFPDLPQTAATGTNALPGNAQGQNGGQGAGKKTPAAPAAGGKTRTGRSVGAGLLTGLGTALIDAATSPSGPGAIAASALGAALIGGGAGVAADPQDQDLFFYGQEQTPPLDPFELTTQESISVAISIDPVISPRQTSTITTNYTYTRITDQQTYNYAGSEVLTFDRILPVGLQVSPTAYQPGDTLVVRASPETVNHDPLRGADVMVIAMLFSADGMSFHGELLLQDDGQGVDTGADDGTYSGSFPTAGLGGDLKVVIQAAQTGFYQDAVPAAYGYEYAVVSGDSVLFADDFESTDTSNWSATVGAP